MQLRSGKKTSSTITLPNPKWEETTVGPDLVWNGAKVTIQIQNQDDGLYLMLIISMDYDDATSFNPVILVDGKRMQSDDGVDDMEDGESFYMLRMGEFKDFGRLINFDITF